MIVGLAFVVLSLLRRLRDNCSSAWFPGPAFVVTENEVFCEALAYARSNEANPGSIQSDPENRAGGLRLQWADASKRGRSARFRGTSDPRSGHCVDLASA